MVVPSSYQRRGEQDALDGFRVVQRRMRQGPGAGQNHCTEKARNEERNGCRTPPWTERLCRLSAANERNTGDERCQQHYPGQLDHDGGAQRPRYPIGRGHRLTDIVHTRAHPGAEGHHIKTERHSQRGQDKDGEAAAQGYQRDGDSGVFLISARDRLHGRDGRRSADREARGDQQAAGRGYAKRLTEQLGSREGHGHGDQHDHQTTGTEVDQLPQGQLQS